MSSEINLQLKSKIRSAKPQVWHSGCDVDDCQTASLALRRWLLISDNVRTVEE
ncbi:Uncharacterized protein dnm_090310 [Desulfonema magnum]|uniref:Uncharacterized protein n=1 Tax=Desulfonema magnum TaxID=45655 RepID=A0A975GU89_9BACT|nr:Uncharacterized protein dnm_090310 [Desulfonema magnum]